MKKILRTIDGVSKWSGETVSYVIYVGILMLVYEVISRYFFQAPTVWAHGYTQRIFGSYFILVGAYTLLLNGHVRVDILYREFPIRIRALFDILNYSLMILWTSVLVKEGITFFLNSWGIRETDEMALAHPIYPIKFILVLGVSLILLQGLSKIAVSCITLIKGEIYEY